MKPLRVLYVGPVSGTCLDRAHAMRRLGHEVTHIDLRHWLPQTAWVDRITWRLGGHWFAWWLSAQIRRRLAAQKFDLVYVDNGEHVSPAVVRAFKTLAPKVVNYCVDDPTGKRDGRRFLAYRMALPHYDLVAVMRDVNVMECTQLGAKRTLRVWFSCDEIAHAPRAITPDVFQKWSSDVLFVGTWMPERGPFLLALKKQGVPLTIRGKHWQKAPEWPELQACWKGAEVAGADYAYALQCAKINIGLLSKGNRDLHTTRSLEIPSLGSLLCAERTSEHTAMYEDGKEAVFWSDATECARLCHQLLNDEALRVSLAKAGQLRFKANQQGNEDVVAHVLAESLK